MSVVDEVPARLPLAAVLRWLVHGLLYLLVIITGLTVLRDTAGTDRVVLVVLLIGIVSVYSIGARRSLHRGTGPFGSWRNLPHLGLTVVLWAATFLIGPHGVWIAFALDFGVLYALPLLGGLLGLVVVTAIAVIGFAAWGPDGGAAQVVGPAIGALVALAVVLAVRALQQEIDQRTRLAERLLAARSTIDQQEREAATAAERDRIARELHDTVAQSALSIQMMLDAALAAWDRPGDGDGAAPGDGGTAPTTEGPERDDDVIRGAGHHDARSLVREARAAAARTSAQTRRFVDGDAADAIRGEDLPDLLAEVARDASPSGRPEIRVRCDATPQDLADLPARTAHTLLRLAQTVTANVVQHADADRAIITLSRDGDDLLLDVVDDGIGFDPDRETGFGLRTARARAASVGGRLTIESAPGSPTAVQASLPLPDVPGGHR